VIARGSWSSVHVPPLSAQLRVCEKRGLTHRMQLIKSALGIA
jgi:hypothetical protein